MISWDVVIEAHLDENRRYGWEGPATAERRRWLEVLQADGDCEPAIVLDTYQFEMSLSARSARTGEIGWVQYASIPVAVLRVQSRSAAHAASKAERIVMRARAAAEWTGGPKFAANGAYPTGSQLAAWNAHL